MPPTSCDSEHYPCSRRASYVRGKATIGFKWQYPTIIGTSTSTYLLTSVGSFTFIHGLYPADLLTMNMDDISAPVYPATHSLYYQLQNNMSCMDKQIYALPLYRYPISSGTQTDYNPVLQSENTRPACQIVSLCIPCASI